MKKPFILSLVVLELLFAACAISVVAYQFTGRFDFGFGVLSYRFFNIAISVLIVAYLIYGLLRRSDNILPLAIIFSIFHLAEGVFIHFWFKVVIHLLILLACGYYYYNHRTLRLA